MKILLGLTLLMAAAVTNAACAITKPVVYLPVGVLTEMCFETEVTNVKYGNKIDIELQIENLEIIPEEYTAKGIRGVVNLIARKPGIVSNIFVDTKDGKRVEVTLITTSSNVEVK